MWMMVLVLRKERKLEKKDTKFSFGLTEFEMLLGISRPGGLELRRDGDEYLETVGPKVLIERR